MANTVPCNGCTACCKGSRIILQLDEVSKYLTVPNRRGNDGPKEWMLPHKPNGDCHYLGDTGCTIHDDAPQVCREFDCRKWFISFDPIEQETVLASSLDSACAHAARERS